MDNKRKYTLDDVIVRDIIEGVSVLDNVKRRIIMAGGMAGQSYTKDFSNYWRPTMDIDYATSPFLSKQDFEEINAELSELLSKKDISVCGGKAHNNYELICENMEDKVIVHFDRFSKNYYERVRQIEEKKVNDAVKITIPKTELEVRVVRPEHYLNGKLKRLSKFHREKCIPDDQTEAYKAAREFDFDTLSRYKILNELPNLIEERDILIVMPKDFDMFQERLRDYKRDKDIYDVCLFSKAVVSGCIEFDENYMLEIMKQVEEVYGATDPQTKIERFTLPGGI